MPLHACTLCDAGRTHVQWWPSACARRQSPGFPVTSRAGGQLASGDYKAKKTIARTKSEGLMVLQDAVVFVPFASFFLSLSVWTGPGLNTQKASTKKKVTHARVSLSTR